MNRTTNSGKTTLVQRLLEQYKNSCKVGQDDFFLVSGWNVDIHEPVHEKTNNWGFRPGLTQIRLYSYRR